MTTTDSIAQPKKKRHPIVFINYIPRITASTFFILIVWSTLGNEFFNWKYIWILVVGLTWPHLIYFCSVRAKDGKKSEVISMHIDAFLIGLAVSATPNYYLYAASMTLLCANGLYIGGFRLLSQTLSAYFAAIAAVNWWSPIVLIEVDLVPKLLTSSLLLIQFSTFAWVGYHQVKKLVRLNKKVKELSLTDPLTHCFNRLYLDKNLTREIQRCRRMNYPLAIIFADLDHFKAINDNYGHQAGDEILTYFVKAAQSSIRENVDWIARFGGEEFVFVLPNSTAKNGAVVAERVRSKLF